MLANRFRQCQSNERLCYSRPPNSDCGSRISDCGMPERPVELDRRLEENQSSIRILKSAIRLVSPQSFPHLWKKLWKIHGNRRAGVGGARFSKGFDGGETVESRQDGASSGSRAMNP